MSQDSLGTETELGKFFLDEWIEEILYSGHWFKIKVGTYKEVEILDGVMVVYQDPFDDMLVFVLERVVGFKVKRPEPPPLESNIVPFRDTR